MSAPPVRDVSLSDLGELSVRGVVAMALRSARRLRPHLDQLPAGFPDRAAALTAVDAGLATAEAYLAAAPVDSVRAAAVAFDVRHAAKHAEDFGQFAAYAAYHATRAAAEALRLGEEISGTDFMEIVACAYGAIRVLLTRGTGYRQPEEVANAVRAAVRADYETLRGLARGTPRTAGAPLDASDGGALGPLWPSGTPEGY